MLQMRIIFGSFVLLDLVIGGRLEVEDAPVEDEPALPFGFVHVEHAEPAPDPVFRDLE